MKKALVITEGKYDAEILKEILPTEITENVEFVSGSGYYSAQSLARSVLVTKHIPTVLILDADSNNENLINEKQSYLNEALNSVSVGTKFKVFLIVPEIEVLFLENPNFIRKLKNENVTENELNLAKTNPKKFLNTSYQNLLANLDEETLVAMKNHKLIKELTEFLSSILNDSQTSSLALNK